MFASPLASTPAALGAVQAKRRRYKDYSFPDGYVYRQYLDDRSILIVKSPRGKGGQLLAPDTKAWIAVDAQLQQARRDKTAADVRTGVQVGTQVLSTTSDIARAVSAGKRRRRRRTPAAEPVESPPPEAPAEIPWLWVVGGGAVLVFFLSRPRRSS